MARYVIDTRTLIDYREGAIVNKTILDDPEGTVTLFAFDKGQTLSNRVASADAVVKIIDGEAEIICGGKSGVYRPNEIVVMPANTPHTVKANERTKMYFTTITPR